MTVTRRWMMGTLLALALAPMGVEAAQAQPLNFTIDPNHTQVMFRVRHLGVSWVTGRFARYSGTFVLDSTNVGASSASLDIETASITTEHDRRDTHLKSNDFFAADSFPQLTFRSTRVERGSEPGTYRVTGDLTIRGRTRSVTLDAEQTGLRITAGRQGGRQALIGFTLSGRINRHDFGLAWNNLVEAVQVVGDEVRITVEVEARAPVN